MCLHLNRDGSIYETTVGLVKDALEISKTVDMHTSFEYD